MTAPPGTSCAIRKAKHGHAYCKLHNGVIAMVPISKGYPLAPPQKVVEFLEACHAKNLKRVDEERAQNNGHDVGAQPQIGNLPAAAKTPVTTLLQVKSFLHSWFTLIKEGAVTPEVRAYRQTLCDGVPGVNPPCPQRDLAKDGKSVICRKCGCGDRLFAVLSLNGTPLDQDPSVRLWMPDPKCPINAIRRMKGTGSLAAVGGKAKQMMLLLKAGAMEARRLGADRAERRRVMAELMKPFETPQ